MDETHEAVVTQPATLGQRIREARLARGLTQAALAHPTLSKGFISLLEHDQTRPSLQTLELLAQRLGRPLSYFLAGVEGNLSRSALRALELRGRIELRGKRYDAALETFGELRNLAAPQHDDGAVTTAILGRGEALLGLRRLDDARGSLDDALARGRAQSDPLVECRALHALATVEHRTIQYGQAVALYRQALEVVPRLEGAEPALHGEILLYLSTVLFRMGRLEESLEACTQARRIFEEVATDRLGEAHMNLGVVHYQSGRYDEAMLHYARALELLEQHEDLLTLSRVRNNLGMVLVEAGRPDEALEHLTSSLSMAQRLGDRVGECQTWTELARCHLASGDPVQAREVALQALAKAHEANLPDEVARAQIVVGVTASAQGDLAEAQRFLQAAATHCEHAALRQELVVAHRGLAWLAALQGHYEDTAAHHAGAHAALRSLSPHDAAAALHQADLVERSLLPASKVVRRPEPPKA